MASLREAPLIRLLLARFPRRGEAAAIQDARRLRRLLRFGVVFVVTILLPSLLLAWLALESIRSEELALDADLRARAAALEAQVQQELSGVFERFEAQTRQRVDAGGTPLDRLGELSPFLRVAFRLDAGGQLAAPFVVTDEPRGVRETAAFRAPWREGVRASLRRDHAAAALAFDRARLATDHPALRAEAAFASARAQLRSGRAPSVLADVYADHAGQRDQHGFRVGDLVVLEQAHHRMGDDPETAAAALQELITDLLNRRWVLGVPPPAPGPGEPTVVRAALDALPITTDPDWLARSRNRLNERIEQLTWAESVIDELDLVVAATPRVPEGRFVYPAQNAATLWAAARLGGDLTLFVFDQQALATHLAATARRSSENDAELRATLVPTGQPVDDSAIVQRALGPWASHITLALHHGNPAALESQKNRRRTTRILVILLSLFLVGVGIVLTARIVGRELENARMKADFAANVSHELRSPITHIRLKGESLQLDLVTDEADRREHYDAIVREAERLSRLVDNVLDFAAIERGAKRYQLRPDDLGAVVALHAEVLGATLPPETTLELMIPDDLPRVWMDRDALGQVFTNLLSNAAKYGAEGRWIGVAVRAEPDRVDVAISDRGIGIAPADLGQIFDDFFRSTDPRVRRNKGTGIGLSIVRYIVEAHGGSISVASEAGEGTTFTVRLPLEPPEGAGGPVPHAAHPVR